MAQNVLRLIRIQILQLILGLVPSMAGLKIYRELRSYGKSSTSERERGGRQTSQRRLASTSRGSKGATTYEASNGSIDHTASMPDLKGNEYEKSCLPLPKRAVLPRNIGTVVWPD